MDWLAFFGLLALPFVCTKWIAAVRRMEDTKDASAGPLPWCILMSVIFGLVWLSLLNRL